MSNERVVYKSIVGQGVLASRSTPDIHLIVVWVKEETIDAVIGWDLGVDGEILTTYPKKDYKFYLVGEQIH